MLATMALFYGVLTFAAPNIQRPGTKELALLVKARARPGDRVMHYHEFFHDFTFYAQRTVGIVAFKGELELEDGSGGGAERTIHRAKPSSAANGPGPGAFLSWPASRTRKNCLPTRRSIIICSPPTRDHYLFSNQP